MRLFACLAVVYSMAAQAAENPLAIAQAALSDGEYEKAYELFLPHATTGDGLAQFSAGLILHNQWIEPRAGQPSGCEWFLDAAHNGIPMAQQLVGDCFVEGKQLDEDPDKAIAWYERAARSGMYSANCKAGELYLQGVVAGKSTEEAVQLCIDSANRGGMEAALSLGKWFLNGIHVEADPVQAMVFLTPVAPRNPEAAYLLAQAYGQSADDPEHRRLAVLWFETAASRGYLPAYLPTARLYFSDQTSGESEAKAYLWIKATLARSEDQTTSDQAADMLETLLARIPSSWPEQLEPELEAHLREVGKVARQR